MPGAADTVLETRGWKPREPAARMAALRGRREKRRDGVPERGLSSIRSAGGGNCALETPHGQAWPHAASWDNSRSGGIRSAGLGNCALNPNPDFNR